MPWKPNTLSTVTAPLMMPEAWSPATVITGDVGRVRPGEGEHACGAIERAARPVRRERADHHGERHGLAGELERGRERLQTTSSAGRAFLIDSPKLNCASSASNRPNCTSKRIGEAMPLGEFRSRLERGIERQ